MIIAHCRSCRAPIVWMHTKKGARMPVDVDSLAMSEPEIAELPADTLFEYGAHVSHFSSCPDAPLHRK